MTKQTTALSDALGSLALGAALLALMLASISLLSGAKPAILSPADWPLVEYVLACLLMTGMSVALGYLPWRVLSEARRKA